MRRLRRHWAPGRRDCEYLQWSGRACYTSVMFRGGIKKRKKSLEPPRSVFRPQGVGEPSNRAGPAACPVPAISIVLQINFEIRPRFLAPSLSAFTPTFFFYTWTAAGSNPAIFCFFRRIYRNVGGCWPLPTWYQERRAWDISFTCFHSVVLRRSPAPKRLDPTRRHSFNATSQVCNVRVAFFFSSFCSILTSPATGHCPQLLFSPKGPNLFHVDPPSVSGLPLRPPFPSSSLLLRVRQQGTFPNFAPRFRRILGPSTICQK